MTDAVAYFDEGLSRRDLLRRGLIGGGVVAAALATPGLSGVARAAGGKSITLDVDANGFADFELTGTDPAGGDWCFLCIGRNFRAGDNHSHWRLQLLGVHPRRWAGCRESRVRHRRPWEDLDRRH